MELKTPTAISGLKQKLGLEIKKNLEESPYTAIVPPLTLQDQMDRETDRSLRRMYAKWLIGILIGQLIIMNLVIMGTGVKCLTIKDSVLNLYMGGTLAEVFGVVLVITKYLFPNHKNDESGKASASN